MLKEFYESKFIIIGYFSKEKWEEKLFVFFVNNDFFYWVVIGKVGILLNDFVLKIKVCGFLFL